MGYFLIALFALPVMILSIWLLKAIGIPEDYAAFSSIVIFMLYIIGGLKLMDRSSEKDLKKNKKSLFNHCL